jgi:hypothetical protein
MASTPPTTQNIKNDSDLLAQDLRSLPELLTPLFKLHPANGHEPRQGLTRLPRKGAEAWPARCGGDFRSPRKPAGPAFRQPRSSPESPAAALKQPQQPTIKRNFKTHMPNGHELLSLPPIGGRTPAFVITLKHSIWPLRRIISKRWLGAWMR